MRHTQFSRIDHFVHTRCVCVGGFSGFLFKLAVRTAKALGATFVFYLLAISARCGADKYDNTQVNIDRDVCDLIHINIVN